MTHGELQRGCAQESGVCIVREAYMDTKAAGERTTANEGGNIASCGPDSWGAYDSMWRLSGRSTGRSQIGPGLWGVRI